MAGHMINFIQSSAGNTHGWSRELLSSLSYVKRQYTVNRKVKVTAFGSTADLVRWFCGRVPCGSKLTAKSISQVDVTANTRLVCPLKTGSFGTGVFRGNLPWLGGAEDDEGIEVFGRAEGVHPEAGSGRDPVAEICRRAGISQATYFNWKKKYDGLLPTEMKRLKQLEDENGKLRKLVADLSLDKEMLQDVIRRKL
jgi:putative transposase